MKSPPETRYAKSGDISIAYQVVGEGPLDLVYVPGWVSNVELMWQETRSARFLERLASFSRLILFDKRGTGMSDRDVGLPTLEQRMDDVRAVMDAVGSERAALFGHSEGGNMCLLFAATYPDRTLAVVTFGVFAKRLWAPDYPWAPTPEEREAYIERVERTWGTDADLAVLASSAEDDPAFARWLNSYFRQGASPRVAAALARMNTFIDVRDVLPMIRVPVLVLHRTGDREVDVEEGRYIASRIPHARFVELTGGDHFMFTEDADGVLDEIEEFLTGVRRGPDSDRVLATVLFTDIVGSTERAAKAGDTKWREALAQHDAAARRELGRFRGREVKTTGDGFLAIFDGPARAIRCAEAIREAVGRLGIEVRAGVHTGEVEVVGDDVAGIAVHIAARVMAAAVQGEVLVSSTVRDLVAGSGVEFEDRGLHALKGVPGEWRILAARG